MKKIYIKYKEVINYLIFGFLTTVISLVVYYASTMTIFDVESSLELQLANTISWCAGVLFAYFTNRKFVFNSTNENKLNEFITFTTSRISTLLLDMFIMFVFVTLLKYNDQIIKLISQVLVIVGNYLLSKLIVFKKETKWKK